MKFRRSLAARLTERSGLFGFIVTQADAALAEIASQCGYDFLVFDREHGLIDERDCLRMLYATEASGTARLVRLRAEDDGAALGRYLDMGVDGFVVPHVETVEHATTLVRAMQYPPTGTRGFGAPAHRETGYGAELAAHVARPIHGVDLLLMIESGLGVANVEAILAVEGVSGVVVGPSDLSANLGALRDFAQPAYAEAMVQIEAAATKSGKVLGTVPHADYSIEALLTRGHRLFIIGGDVPLMREAMSTQLIKARASLEREGACMQEGDGISQ